MDEKLKKAEFDFNDFLDYMGQIKNMGGIGSILSMMPGTGSWRSDEECDNADDDAAEITCAVQKRLSIP